jgi:hypothetical protein
MDRPLDDIIKESQKDFRKSKKSKVQTKFKGGAKREERQVKEVPFIQPVVVKPIFQPIKSFIAGQERNVQRDAVEVVLNPDLESQKVQSHSILQRIGGEEPKKVSHKVS